MTNPTTTADQIARDEVDEIIEEAFHLSPLTEHVDCEQCDGTGYRTMSDGSGQQYQCPRCDGFGSYEARSDERPADEFRRHEAGCAYRTREGHVWMSPALIADLMDRAYRAGRESV